MINDCNNGKIDMVITKSISRFARNTVDCLNYTRALKNKNINVYFEKENINTLDAKGEVLMTNFANLGIYYCHGQGVPSLNPNPSKTATIITIKATIGVTH